MAQDDYNDEKPKRKLTIGDLAKSPGISKNFLRDLEISGKLKRNAIELQKLSNSAKTIADLYKPIDLSSNYPNSLAALANADLRGTAILDVKYQDLENQIHNLRERISSQTSEVNELKGGAERKEEKIATLEQDLESLRSKERLRHLLDRVGPEAQESLLSSTKLLNLFEELETCDAYVISIDVRRSTDLMLKAREPKLFAEFITELADQLRQIILARYGIFDKFTGDGVLAYFPSFYSGDDAGLLVADAAQACHEIFERHYRENRHCFLSVIRNLGLGIGIDYGAVTIVKMQGELTIVGTPVVYACRLGGADAGDTLVNQPAYEVLMQNFSEFIDFEETSINFKHEGDMLAYRINRNRKIRALALPEWREEKANKSVESDT